MKVDLQGKVALLSGSTAGIGFAVAEGLLTAGAEVIINGRSASRLQAAVEKLAETGKLVRGVIADAGTPEGCDALIAAVPDVDILINNLGIFAPRPVFDITDVEWERFFAVNVMSGVRLSRHHIPMMMNRGWGRVVFVSSESALQIPVEMVHYGMTKLAQLAVARGFAEATAGSGVTVNSILPGPTRSEGVGQFVRDLVGHTSDAGKIFMETYRPSSLLRRLAEPREVANLAVYLSSHQAAATTGSALRVDGGLIRNVV
ncbi:SDR family NAD(P)-dependent oxidoreductase [Pseudomonas aeruginosa]|uniref:SDR family NAD(P)-dependent oxidoreductase n=1 Tax=Alphaproteobacteria TaxID=28211 RepID=UPI00096AB2F4|nr:MULTISPECIES: SDR family oxidoreductase [Alphaproteobacteria]EKV6967490.1 SDR family oxidoreductase [Pseudomonas aeruginosa]USQ70297.1 SDR family oxidoreductase [Roseomonas mucosa]EKW2845516.1 SDR family oxidoreductase [Pseudomonas aeruginosa]HBO1272389.1 SDR family oxidoreductase [Pseudomonas aeruginosa]HBO1574662.1 SDR family oxidoreductase [Pseudomonas aeruginosa]